MLKKILKEYGFYIITTVVLVAVFSLGFIFGKYAKAAPSLEAIEREQYANTQSVSSIVSETETTSEAEQTEAEPEYTEITVIATAYCPCVKCSEGYGTMTATGVLAEAGRTIAVDPKVIPYGTEVIIDGVTYIAEDCGGAVKGNKVDIFFDTHEEAEQFGRKQLVAMIKN